MQHICPQQQQQLAFLRNLNNFLITNVDIGNLIVGGDWNVTLEAVDKKGGSQWKPTSYRNQLISMMKEFSLIDVYRNLNPSKLCFTYESKALKLSSRIDFFPRITTPCKSSFSFGYFPSCLITKQLESNCNWKTTIEALGYGNLIIHC